MNLTIRDRAVLNEILQLIVTDFPCKDAEDKFGRQVEDNLKEQGIKIDFNQWISEVDLGIK